MAYKSYPHSCYKYQIIDLSDEDHIDGKMFTDEMLSTMKITLKFWVLLKTTFGPENPTDEGNEAVYQIDLRSYDLPHPDSGRKNDLVESNHNPKCLRL